MLNHWKDYSKFVPRLLESTLPHPTDVPGNHHPSKLPDTLVLTGLFPEEKGTGPWKTHFVVKYKISRTGAHRTHSPSRTLNPR